MTREELDRDIAQFLNDGGIIKCYNDKGKLTHFIRLEDGKPVKRSVEDLHK